MQMREGVRMIVNEVTRGGQRSVGSEENEEFEERNSCCRY